jgi:hypothetical protein
MEIEVNRPKIVCLCGSTKFKTAYEKANFEESLKGNIVLSVGCFGHADAVPLTKEQKQLLDELHFAKIDLADEIFVLNVNLYEGESTRNEIRYAQQLGKPIRYLEGCEADCKEDYREDCSQIKSCSQSALNNIPINLNACIKELYQLVEPEDKERVRNESGLGKP